MQVLKPLKTVLMSLAHSERDEAFRAFDMTYTPRGKAPSTPSQTLPLPKEAGRVVVGGGGDRGLGEGGTAADAFTHTSMFREYVAINTKPAGTQHKDNIGII